MGKRQKIGKEDSVLTQTGNGISKPIKADHYFTSKISTHIVKPYIISLFLPAGNYSIKAQASIKNLSSTKVHSYSMEMIFFAGTKKQTMKIFKFAKPDGDTVISEHELSAYIQLQENKIIKLRLAASSTDILAENLRLTADKIGKLSTIIL